MKTYSEIQVERAVDTSKEIERLLKRMQKNIDKMAEMDVFNGGGDRR